MSAINKECKQCVLPKKKKKKSYLVPKSMIRNSRPNFSKFNVKFTKQKISHLNIKKKKEKEKKEE
jgi:hypothetical protein